MDKNRVLIFGLAVIAGLGAYLFFKRNKQAKEKQENQEELSELGEILGGIDADTQETERAEFTPSLDPRAQDGVVPAIDEDEKVYKAWFTENIIEREPIRNWATTQGLVAEFVNYAKKGDQQHMASCLDVLMNQFDVYMFLYALIHNFYGGQVFDKTHPRQIYTVSNDNSNEKYKDKKYKEILHKYNLSIIKLFQIAPYLHDDIINLIFR